MCETRLTHVSRQLGPGHSLSSRTRVPPARACADGRANITPREVLPARSARARRLPSQGVMPRCSGPPPPALNSAGNGRETYKRAGCVRTARSEFARLRPASAARDGARLADRLPISCSSELPDGPSVARTASRARAFRTHTPHARARSRATPNSQANDRLYVYDVFRARAKLTVPSDPEDRRNSRARTHCAHVTEQQLCPTAPSLPSRARRHLPPVGPLRGAEVVAGRARES